jgi:predicted nucleic acid-binding protein
MAGYVADVSALARLHRTDVQARLGPLVLAGEVATCGLVDLGLLATARNERAHAALRADQASLPRVTIDDATLQRAIEVQALLAASGRHRDIPITLLVIAAAAERAGLVLLHDDERVVAIAEASGQPVESVVGQ